MFGNYKLSDAPDSSIVKIEVSMKQLRLLESIVEAELGDVERGDSVNDEKTLQSLCDAFWKHLHIPLTADELHTQNIERSKRFSAANKAYEDSMRKTSGMVVQS